LFHPDGSYHVDMTTERVEKRLVIEHEIAVGERVRTGTHGLEVFGFIDSENPLAKLMPRASGKTEGGSHAQIRFRIDTKRDYTGGAHNLNIVLDGTTYDVDESQLKVLYNKPMTKERLVSAFSTAVGGTKTLADVADIFFDQDDHLVIRSKQEGAAHTVSGAAIASAGVTGLTTTPGVNPTSITIGGGAPIADADIAAATGKHGILMNNGTKTARIEIDMTALNTVSDFGTALQNAINTEFPPAGVVTVQATNGAPLTMTVASGSFAYDAISVKESKMIHDLRTLSKAMTPATYDIEVIDRHIDIITSHVDNVMAAAGEIGGKTNRLEFIKERTDSNTLTFSSLLSGVQDVDYSQAIMMFKNLENVYRASLSVGAKVIQPSLVDFIR
ncbi:MAG: hypothetical protein Q4A52_07825, partial [Bacillota bacterium]|nr:hypothetical protein [Bacillota bacterium]